MQDAYEALQLAASDTASPIDVGVVNDQVCRQAMQQDLVSSVDTTQSDACIRCSAECEGLIIRLH